MKLKVYKAIFFAVSLSLFLAWQSPRAHTQNEVAAPAPEARDYLNRALDIIQKSSVKRNTNWEEFRRQTIEKATQARMPADTYPAIRDALRRLGDNHSHLFTPEELKELEAGKTGGSSGSLGIRVKYLIVITVFPNS